MKDQQHLLPWVKKLFPNTQVYSVDTCYWQGKDHLVDSSHKFSITWGDGDTNSYIEVSSSIPLIRGKVKIVKPVKYYENRAVYTVLFGMAAFYIIRTEGLVMVSDELPETRDTVDVMSVSNTAICLDVLDLRKPNADLR